jgi:hypothetical protein
VHWLNGALLGNLRLSPQADISLWSQDPNSSHPRKAFLPPSLPEAVGELPPAQFHPFTMDKQPSDQPPPSTDRDDSTRQLPDPTESAPPLRGIPLWTLIGGLMLGVYLVGLDMTMLATVSSSPLSLLVVCSFRSGDSNVDRLLSNRLMVYVAQKYPTYFQR